LKVIHASGVPEMEIVSGFSVPSLVHVPLITWTVHPGFTEEAARLRVLNAACGVRPWFVSDPALAST
jgi:hypothetical protein